MAPGMITAIAYLIVEALNAGVEISNLIAEIKKTGKVSDEQWQKIVDDLNAAEDAWNNA